VPTLPTSVPAQTARDVAESQVGNIECADSTVVTKAKWLIIIAFRHCLHKWAALVRNCERSYTSEQKAESAESRCDAAKRGMAPVKYRVSGRDVPRQGNDATLDAGLHKGTEESRVFLVFGTSASVILASLGAAYATLDFNGPFSRCRILPTRSRR
jgi:hypothetical protein